MESILFNDHRRGYKAAEEGTRPGRQDMLGRDEEKTAWCSRHEKMVPAGNLFFNLNQVLSNKRFKMPYFSFLLLSMVLVL